MQNYAISMSAKYGISEKKKAELDALQIDVINAQYDVEQYQAIVTALQLKVQTFDGFLSTADSDKEIALKNKNLVDAVLADTVELLQSSEVAFDQMVEAEVKINDVADKMKGVIDKLIFAVEIINRLEKLILSKKALNPIISDELVKTVQKAGTDGTKAIADCLTALQSLFASTTAGYETEYASSLELEQAQYLFKALTGTAVLIKSELGVQSDLRAILKRLHRGYDYMSPAQKTSLYGQITKAYEDSLNVYQRDLTADRQAQHELAEAEQKLDKAQVKLASLERGLAAAQAAALAS